MEHPSIVNENEVKKPEADKQRKENGVKIPEADQQSTETNTGKIPSSTSDGSGHRLNLEEQRNNDNQKESSDDKFNRSKKSVALADGSNPYVAPSPSSPNSPTSFNFKSTMGNVKDMLGRWRKKVGEASRKAEDLAGNTWQHLKTGPSFADAALGRIAQGTKVLAEGGYEKIFRQTFETVPEEQLQETYACYLSTSAGPVMGVLYVSSAKLAFCSDNPLSYKANDKTEWSYYKLVIPLHQLKAINPSSSGANPAEKYIQVISVDEHEFWFMGFLNYNAAVKCLQETLQTGNLESV